MKLLINAKKLAPALSELSRIAPTRSTLPILSNALLVADEGGMLSITATDLNMTMTRAIAAEVKEPGSTTVPIVRLSELISVFPDQIATLRYDDKKQVLKVSCAATKSDLKTIPTMDFPALEPSNEPLFSIDLNAGELASALREVVFAATEDIARPLLQGVVFDMSPESIRLAAADGFRLARRELIVIPSNGSISKAQFTIFANSVREIAKMLTEQETVNVKVWPGMNHIKFSVQDAEMLVVALNGEYPDFSQLIASLKDRPTKVVLPVNALNNASKACAVIAKDTSYVTKVAIFPSKNETPGTLVVSALESEVGSAESSVDAVVTGTEEIIEFKINLRMVQDVLSVLGDGDLVIELKGALDPIAFRPVGRADYLNVIMPMASKE